MRQKKSSNNHGNIIPISIVSFHYHFLFHSCSGRKQKESLSQFQIAVDVKQFCFLSHIYNAEKKALPYHLVLFPHFLILFVHSKMPSKYYPHSGVCVCVLMEQLMMILIFIMLTQSYTYLHIRKYTSSHIAHPNNE